MTVYKATDVAGTGKYLKKHLPMVYLVHSTTFSAAPEEAAAPDEATAAVEAAADMCCAVLILAASTGDHSDGLIATNHGFLVSAHPSHGLGEREPDGRSNGRNIGPSLKAECSDDRR